MIADTVPSQPTPATGRVGSSKGEFFPVSVEAIDHIAAQGGTAEDALGYLVLARHASIEVPEAGRLTSAGAEALTKAGISYRRAQAALRRLTDNSAQRSDGSSTPFIVTAEKARDQLGVERVPTHFGLGPKGSPATTIRWLLSAFDDPVYLANALIDGTRKGTETPPLRRIYDEVEPNFEDGITMPQSRLDAAMLLIHMYRNTDLETCGGVDPRSGLYREWTLADEDGADGWLDRPPVMELEGTNAALYEVAGKSARVFLSFAAKALAYVPDPDERKLRFWCAFNNLHRLGLVYEVLTVWSDNPLSEDQKKARHAHPLYTLYISSRHARENGEPYLQSEIHSIVLKRGEIEPLELGFDSSERGDATLIESGRFRLVAIKKIGAYPLGVFRLRYRAKDRESGRGIAAEEQRCLEWANCFRAISGRPPLAEWQRQSAQ